MLRAKTRKCIFYPQRDLSRNDNEALRQQEWFPMNVQFSIKNSYPPARKIVVSVPRHGRCQQDQRTHDMCIEVITDSHVDLLLHV
jgi:hypothetical protein